MKEDDEGIPFHTLLTAGMRRGDRILWEKRRQRVCSVPGLHFCSWRLWTGQVRAVAALGKATTCGGVGDGIWWRVDSVGGSSIRAQQGPAVAGVLGTGHRSGYARGRSGAGRRWAGPAC
jgi:hypothetical protein